MRNGTAGFSRSPGARHLGRGVAVSPRTYRRPTEFRLGVVDQVATPEVGGISEALLFPSEDSRPGVRLRKAQHNVTPQTLY